MKSTQFEHLQPRTPLFEKSLEKKIRTQEMSITSKDIALFTDHLVMALKSKREGDVVKTYIIDSLSDEAIIKTFFQEQLPLWVRFKGFVNKEAEEKVEYPPEWTTHKSEELQVMKLEVGRIRRAVQEEFKKRLALDPGLTGIQYSDVFIVESAPYRSVHAKRVLDLNLRAHVFKKQRDIAPDHEEKRLSEIKREHRLHAQALHRLAELPPHEHILRPSQFDAIRFESLMDEIDLEDQEEEARHTRKNPYTFQEDLAVMRDCLKGALFLAQQGIVLQDIHYANIGAYQKDGKRIGALFDLEGVYPLGQRLFGRLSHKGFIPPEVSVEFSVPLLPSEMVYQFGKSFLCILMRWYSHNDLPETYKKEAWQIAEAMTSYDADLDNPVLKRPSLDESIRRFEALLERLPDDIASLR